MHFSGQLKTVSTQMGYPVGLLIWVVVKINDQTVFWSIIVWVEDVSTRLPVERSCYFRFL